jgi:hypothetical protein
MIRAAEGEPMGGADENPFVRGQRGLRPRRDGRAPREIEAAPPVGLLVGLDPSILPPAIGIRAEPEPELVPEPAAAVDAPKRRGRPRKTPLPEAGIPAEG